MLMKLSGRRSAVVLVMAGALVGLLGGCGGGAGAGGAGSAAAGGTTGTGTGSTTTPAPTLSVALTDPTSGATRTSVSSGSPARVTATLRSSSGAAVPNAVVTFSTDPTLATFTPTTALTDASGVATVTLNAAGIGAAGAGTVTATSQVTETRNGTTTTSAANGTLGFAVGPASVTLSPVTLGTNPLSAFGTTSVTVTVLTDGVPTATPLTVTFASPCASSGRAVLTPTVTTVGGVAIASYRDNGCGGSDTITATVSGLATSGSVTLTVIPPTTGSIQFISATPTSITLRGTGGFGRQESSLVRFKVVDAAGNPLGGRTVTFALSTAVGGITLTPCAEGELTCPAATAVSDAVTGEVLTNISAGNVSTPVRVTASTPGPLGTTLSTQSDQLTITTGIPSQDSVSVAATILNIEGLDFDGSETVLTMSMADHFRNPVPDGTAVTFTSEGGRVGGSCTTAAGTCQVTLTSQAFRPANGRLTVLATAIGEEAFVDLSGDGWADVGELVDPNGVSSDTGEAFVDYNENGVRDAATEPFIDFNRNGAFDGPDGLFNGILCDESVAGRSAPGTCSAQRSIHVRDSIVIVFSGSTAVLTGALGFDPSVGVTVAGCDPTGGAPDTATFTVFIHDVNTNTMPAGTRISFATTNGRVTAGPPNPFVVTSNIACLIPGLFGCPATAPALGGFTFTVESDKTVTVSGDPPVSVCTNPSASGALNITVTTPRGLTTSLPSIPINDPSDSVP